MRLDRNELQDSLKAVKNIEPDANQLRQMIKLIDLTSLNETDTTQVITKLCEQAITPQGHVASVCIYPQFVKHAAKCLAGTPVHIATVANFPLGHDSIEQTLRSIRQSMEDGAQEIDVVFPYARYLSGDKETARAFVQKCKEECGHKIKMKVILETGALIELPLIDDASYDAIMAGADFIKTSTGKLGVGATLEAAAVMLMTIRNMEPSLHRTVGFKASGGIRTVEQAARYIELASHIMGSDWVNPHRFRLGASHLLTEILKKF